MSIPLVTAAAKQALETLETARLLPPIGGGGIPLLVIRMLVAAVYVVRHFGP